MTNDIEVVVNYKACGFGMEIVTVYLKTNEGEITLSKKQWDEIKTTMAGHRKSVHSKESAGIVPCTSKFWN